MPRPILLLAPLALGCPDSATDSAPDTAPEQRQDVPFITDDDGRALILHGLNVMSASKSDPDRMPPIEPEIIQRMADDWGFDLSRFLIFWDHVEPNPGEIDQAYLDDVELWLDRHADAGIFVVLDMHQDVYAQRFCCDGAPEWAIRDDGESFTMQGSWFLNYFQPAVQRSFDNFWLYTDGEHADVQEHYIQAWVAVAERFRDHPAVLGYDIINEPSPGSANDGQELLGLENPSGSHPDFDQQRLGPFYQRVIDAIRAVDGDRWIFYEPRYGAPANGLPSYMAPLVDPRPGQQRLVYFPHLYSLKLEAGQSYDPQNDTAIAGWEANRALERQAQGSPLLIGEWGFDSTWDNAHQALYDTLAMADRATSGWSYWSLDPGSWGIVDSEWNERESADILVRPYPQRVAGTPTEYGFDPTTRRFHLAFDDRAGVQGSTVIYLPAARHYPEGWTLSSDDPEGSWSSSWDAAKELLSVETDPSLGSHSFEIVPAG